MKIQINTDNHIEGREELAEEAEATAESTLGQLADHITRIDESDKNWKFSLVNKRAIRNPTVDEADLRELQVTSCC